MSAQAQQNARTADAILALYERLKSQFIAATNSRYAVPLLDAAFQVPYFQASQLAWKAEAPSKPTLMALLQALEQRRVITVYRSAAGRRSSIWCMPGLIELIEKKP